MLSEADKKQCNLLNTILEFNCRARPKAQEDNKKTRDIYESISVLHERRELGLNAFKRGILPLKPTQGKGVTILTL